MAEARAQGRDPDVDAFLADYSSRDVLRLLTCGSVDDGKSTLIGRLLHDAGGLFDDQLAAARVASERYGSTGRQVDFALLLDGLQAEREQGITIDVAYRYFSTARRRFIIADTPGHEQYTRNMATGASTSNLAVILVDAEKGVVDQTRRHAFIASLFGIRHLVLAVNKMDRVAWSEARFDEITDQFADFAAKLQANDIRSIPISALEGDNVVHRSQNMSWYEGATLLDHLETVYVAGDRNLIDFRFPVQLVLRTTDYRGYAGTIASGTVRTGDDVLVIPSGKPSRVRSIDSGSGAIEAASAGTSVTITLEDQIDISRGDMLVHPNNVPRVDQRIEAMVVWLHEQPLTEGSEYLLKQTTASSRARVSRLRYRMNVASLHRESADRILMNEFARLALETPRQLAHDPYSNNRSTGSFILIDPLSNATVGAGTIVDREPADAVIAHRASPDARSNVRTRGDRPEPRRLDQHPFTLWITGLPRSGKSSLALALDHALFDLGLVAQVLDGESLRLGISSDLGFSPRDRHEHVRRTAEIARMANDYGIIAIVSLVSPSIDDRALARRIIGDDRFLEVYANAPIDVCESRDTDRLFERARAGELLQVSGIDLPYEPPPDADIELDTASRSVPENITRLLSDLRSRGLVTR